MRCCFLITFTIAFLLLTVCSGYGQEKYILTKAFDKKLKDFQLEYLSPEDTWLHPVPYEDEYAEYDLVLYADDQTLEVRYIFQGEDSPIALSMNPHLEFYRSVIDFASNEPEANEIRIQDISSEQAKKKYNADWCLEAYFTPKEDLTLKSKGKILGIYKDKVGLIFCMILHDREEASPYFDLPIRFLN